MWSLYSAIASVLLLSSVSAQSTGVYCGNKFFPISLLKSTAIEACTILYTIDHYNPSDPNSSIYKPQTGLSKEQKIANKKFVEDAQRYLYNSFPSTFPNQEGFFEPNGGPYISWHIREENIIYTTADIHFAIAKWDGQNCEAVGAMWIDNGVPKKCHEQIPKASKPSFMSRIGLGPSSSNSSPPRLNLISGSEFIPSRFIVQDTA